MKNVLKFIGTIVFSLFIVSCSATEETASLSVEERFAKAKAAYDDENYLEAIEDFKAITVQSQGSEFGDDAQFYLAECRFNREEFILAAAEYDNLVRLMPASSFVNFARYKRAESYYQLSPKPQLDQKYTRYALDNFQTYVEYAGTDTLVADATAKIQELTLKLSQKMFEGGKLYYRLEYFKASISYFDKLIQDYHDSPFVDDGMMWKAKSQNERKDFDGAVQTLNELMSKFPSTDLTEEITALRKEIEEDRIEYQEDQKKRQLSITE
ncbi:MAG: outer membrane protein assembly factor BamD [Bacteroidetes bacterium]|nr:outer membrane protein assembly factor BamD [Bacteroidota bacterium]